MSSYWGCFLNTHCGFNAILTVLCNLNVLPTQWRKMSLMWFPKLLESQSQLPCLLSPFPREEERNLSSRIVHHLPGVVDILLGKVCLEPLYSGMNSFHSVEMMPCLVGKVPWEFTEQLFAKMLPEKNWTTALSGVIFIWELPFSYRRSEPPQKALWGQVHGKPFASLAE